MKILSLVIALGFLAFGAIAFLLGRGAPHEIEGLIMVLTGTIIICAVAVIRALESAINQFKAQPQPD